MKELREKIERKDQAKGSNGDISENDSEFNDDADDDESLNERGNI